MFDLATEVGSIFCTKDFYLLHQSELSVFGKICNGILSTEMTSPSFVAHLSSGLGYLAALRFSSL